MPGHRAALESHVVLAGRTVRGARLSSPRRVRRQRPCQSQDTPSPPVSHESGLLDGGRSTSRSRISRSITILKLAYLTDGISPADQLSPSSSSRMTVRINGAGYRRHGNTASRQRYSQIHRHPETWSPDHALNRVVIRKSIFHKNLVSTVSGAAKNVVIRKSGSCKEMTTMTTFCRGVRELFGRLLDKRERR